MSFVDPSSGVVFDGRMLHGAGVTVSRQWLFSPSVDGAVFGGSALGAALVVLLARALGVVGDAPLWAWLVFVLAIDVAHVWATLFRVYLDAEERARRPLLYLGAPPVVFALTVCAYAMSADTFWRVLAYVAVFHFIRQQVGWVTLYGRRAGDGARTVQFDRLAVWAATLGPVVWWHANLPRPFSWFRDGDFVTGLPRWVGTAALLAHAVVLAAWLVVQLRRGRSMHLGKLLLVASTWVVWFGGIVLARDDFAFTVLNVTAHGVPYLALLFRYATGRAAQGGYGRLGALVRGGAVVFVGALVALAFVEELAWDQLVWHERARVFGDFALEVPDGALVFLVPLLSLPQTTHYLLDGFVWRTREDPALAARLGW